MNHIIFLSEKELKELENGEMIQRDIEGERIRIVRVDSLMMAHDIIDKENKQGVLEQIAEKQKTLLDTTKAWSAYIDKNGNIY